MRHRLTILGVWAAAATAGGFACGDDEPAPRQGVFWLGLSPAQGGTCSSSRTFVVPEGARDTIVSTDAQGDRIVDSGADQVICSVSPVAGAEGSFRVSMRLSSGEIGDFSGSGTMSKASGGQFDLNFTTTSFSLQQEGCTVTVETVKAGAVWIKSLNCPNLRERSSPSIACVGNGGIILENCDS